MNWIISWFWIIDCLNLIYCEKVLLLNTSINGWNNWKKNTKTYEGWRIQNLPPNADEVYGVCEVDQSSANSWLRSPFISRDKGISLHIRVSFTMRECKNYPDPKSLKHCEETFTLLKYESDSPIENILYNERTFAVIGTISSNRKWETKDRTENILNIYQTSMSVRRLGVIIAFQNTGSCVMIKEVVVYYLACQEKISNFISFPRTAAGFEGSSRNVVGRCIEGGLRKHNSDEQIVNYCQANGLWKDISVKEVCECGPGMEGNDNKTRCIKCSNNFYKPYQGTSNCVPCPKSTYSFPGSGSCACNEGYYEIPNTKQKMICKKPPDKPKNIQIDSSDQARIILTWSSPFYVESSESVSDNISYYLIECVNCPNKLNYLPSDKTLNTKVIVLGSLPSREYDFKVSSVNDVSQYVTNPFDIDQSSSKISLLTKPLENIEKLKLKSIQTTKEGIVLFWEKPISPVDIFEYECVSFGFRDYSKTTDVFNADSISHVFTTNTSCSFANLMPDLIYFVAKVRPRNHKGWGQFSDTKAISRKRTEFKIKTPTKIRLTNFVTTVSFSTITDMKTFNINPEKDVVMMILGSILLVAVLLIIIVLVTYCIRRQMMFNMYRQKFKNEKFEATSPTQIIYSSAYSLPNQTYNKYQNPNTYEDISVALHDFTKEIDPKWLTTSSVIGQGEFGHVYQGVLFVPEEDRKIVAVKVLKIGASEKEKNDFLVEASTMGQFLNENVLKLEGVITSSDSYMIVTEYMVNGSLLTYLRIKKSELTTIQLLKMLSNVANGMKYLSSIGFIHRDLAARNILLDENLVCKVADFGLSRELSGKDADDIYTNKPDGKLPIKWTAPEAILYGKFSHASDVWSYGVVCWEVLSYGEKPYWQWSNHEVIDAIQSGYRLPPPVNCPPIMHNLMLHCWNLNSDKRPTFPHIFYEIEQISSQLCVTIKKNEIDRKDFKNCETAHLLMHCNDLNKDPVYDVTAPQPPPRNMILDIKGSKIGVAPEMNNIFSMYPRKSFGCLNNPGSNDLTNTSPKMEDGSQTITLTRVNHQNIFHQPYQYFQNKTFYQPCLSQGYHESHSFAPDFFSSKFPEIPPHRNTLSRTKLTRIPIEEFLNTLHLSHFIPNFLKNGIYYTDQISQIKTDQLKMIGISSVNDQKKIIRAVQPPMYC